MKHKLSHFKGVVPTQFLLQNGWSKHKISRAIQSGDMSRIRQGWLALPQPDPDLLQAAKFGGVLTCVSQAVRAGLWVPKKDHLHLGLRSNGRSLIGKDRVTSHWHRPLVQRHPWALEDSLINTLQSVLLCQPQEDALIILESALNKRLISGRALLSLDFPKNSKSIIKLALPFSDSGLETIFRTRLRFLQIPIRQQTHVLGHRVDFLLGDRLVIQIDGGSHIGKQRIQDNSHDAQLLLDGYHVIRIGYAQIIDAWPEVQDTIMRAVARGLHLA